MNTTSVSTMSERVCDVCHRRIWGRYRAASGWLRDDREGDPGYVDNLQICFDCSERGTGVRVWSDAVPWCSVVFDTIGQPGPGGNTMTPTGRPHESHGKCDRCASTLVIRRTYTGSGKITGEWLCTYCVQRLPEGSFAYAPDPGVPEVTP